MRVLVALFLAVVVVSGCNNGRTQEDALVQAREDQATEHERLRVSGCVRLSKSGSTYVLQQRSMFDSTRWDNVVLFFGFGLDYNMTQCERYRNGDTEQRCVPIN